MIELIINAFDLDDQHLLNKLSKEDLAYIAGIVDGEGCILIRQQKDKYEKQYFNSRFQLKMSDDVVIPWLAGKLDAKFYKEIPNNKNARPTNVLVLSGLKGVFFIIKILPYLKLKRKQAEIFIRLVWIQQTSKRLDRDFELQRQLYFQMKHLNKVGNEVGDGSCYKDKEVIDIGF